MKELKITAATDQQLRDFLTTNLQIEGVTATSTRAQLMALLGPVWKNDMIFVEDDGSSITGEVVVPDAKFRYATGRDDGPPTRVTIMQTGGINGKHPAHPSVNGRKLVIQRNVPVDIPYAFFLALDNAVQTKITDTGDGSKAYDRTNFTDYPMKDVVKPPQSEIDDWHRRNGNRVLGESAPVALAA